MPEQWTPEVGDSVVYRAFPDAKPEDGLVTRLSTDPSLVFVRYGVSPYATSKATRVADLEPAPPSLEEVVARMKNSSLTDPTWRTDYRV